jgi:hypothetical protein
MLLQILGFSALVNYHKVLLHAPESRILVENLIVTSLVKKIRVFSETQSSTTILTGAHHTLDPALSHLI